jgi:hypothetical protein
MDICFLFVQILIFNLLADEINISLALSITYSTNCKCKINFDTKVEWDIIMLCFFFFPTARL